MKTKLLPSWFGVACIVLFSGMTDLPVAAYTANEIVSPEAAVIRFGAACDNEIRQAVPRETMTRINHLRDSSSLTVVRKSSKNFAYLSDPKALAKTYSDLYGSQKDITKCTGDIWILSYTSGQDGLVIYIDATSGSVICIDFVPEG